MQTLVTGGAGFIGSHIVEALVRRGDKVRILDNLSSGNLENLAGVAGDVEFIEGDIRDAALAEQACRGCELVFHQAAIVSVPYSVKEPQISHDVNIQGTLNVLLGARNSGARRLMFACSAAVYGNSAPIPQKEHQQPQPDSPYGLEKLAGEHYCRLFTQLYQLETVSLRYFNIFGPRQDPSSPYSGVISIFVNCLLQGKTPTIFGDGEQSRDFVFVDNVVQANLLAAETDDAPGQYFNIGCGSRTTLNDLVRILGEIDGRDFSAEHGPQREGDIRDSLADISAAQERLGYQPTVDVKRGLERLLEAERAALGEH